MKIAIFSDTFPPEVNGVASMIYQSAAAFADRGHEVRIFTVGCKTHVETLPSGGSFRVTSRLSIPSFIYKGTSIPLPFTPLDWAGVRRFKPDIIHSHTTFPMGWEAVAVAKMGGYPLVGTHHTFYDHYLKHVKMDYAWGKKFSWKYTVRYYNFCDAVISPSESLAEGLRKNGLKRPVAVIPNPADTGLFRPASAAEKAAQKKKYGIPGPSLVYMGRLSYEKSVDKVLRAFAAARRQNDLRCMVIGDGPEKEALEELAEKLGIREETIFTGILRGQKLVEALWANDIFLTASKSENAPVSVIEAMASGLPAVVVDKGGLPEMVADGGNGRVVPADDPDRMAAAALDLLRDPEKLKASGRNSRTAAERYSPDKCARAVEDLYQKVIHESIAVS